MKQGEDVPSNLTRHHFVPLHLAFSPITNSVNLRYICYYYYHPSIHPSRKELTRCPNQLCLCLFVILKCLGVQSTIYDTFQSSLDSMQWHIEFLCSHDNPQAQFRQHSLTPHQIQRETAIWPYTLPPTISPFPAYNSTFHSCQGLSLDLVGVDLTQNVFTRGRLYMVLSRIRHCSHAIVRFPSSDHSTTVNATYRELLIR